MTLAGHETTPAEEAGADSTPAEPASELPEWARPASVNDTAAALMEVLKAAGVEEPASRMRKVGERICARCGGEVPACVLAVLEDVRDAVSPTAESEAGESSFGCSSRTGSRRRLGSGGCASRAGRAVATTRSPSPTNGSAPTGSGACSAAKRSATHDRHAHTPHRRHAPAKRVPVQRPDRQRGVRPAGMAQAGRHGGHQQSHARPRPAALPVPRLSGARPADRDRPSRADRRRPQRRPA
jgi:hypothetical protein